MLPRDAIIENNMEKICGFNEAVFTFNIDNASPFGDKNIEKANLLKDSGAKLRSLIPSIGFPICISSDLVIVSVTVMAVRLPHISNKM